MSIAPSSSIQGGLPLPERRPAPGGGGATAEPGLHGVTSPERHAPGGNTGVPAAAGGQVGRVPDGVDPALWNILTGEERAYFDRARGGGGLTYGRASAGEAKPPSPRGLRIDVRV